MWRICEDIKSPCKIIFFSHNTKKYFLLKKMRKLFIQAVLKINTFFPKKNHPFDNLKNGIADMNYTQFEYDHAEKLLDQYKNFIDLEELQWKRILEIGSWWGWKIIYIAQKYNADATGIDLNQHFLQQAHQKAEELKVSQQVEFKQMDALNMSFWDNYFDIVLMSDVLEHIPHTERLISEVLRVTKKWGKILFDFAPYYHYFWHHIWDRVSIPWLHLFVTDNFMADIYEQSLQWFSDKQKRLDLRISHIWNKKEFTYLNKISRKKFENIIQKYEDMWIFQNCTIRYFMLKNIDLFSKIPIIREIFIRHIIWVIQK